MKSISVNSNEMEVLRVPLETVVLGSLVATTVRDIRAIDKILDILDKASICLVDGAAVDVELEDADFTYLKDRYSQFSSWNPGSSVIRKTVSTVADKLGIGE